MTGIEDRIEEMREMAVKFERNEILPDCANLAKICASLREVLSWIKQREDDRMETSRILLERRKRA